MCPACDPLITEKSDWIYKQTTELNFNSLWQIKPQIWSIGQMQSRFSELISVLKATRLHEGKLLRHTQTHHWFHSYAAIWEGQQVVLCSLPCVFLDGSGQQREIFLLLLLLKPWAFPRERKGGSVWKRDWETNKNVLTETKDTWAISGYNCFGRKETQQVVLLATWEEGGGHIQTKRLKKHLIKDTLLHSMCIIVLCACTSISPGPHFSGWTTLTSGTEQGFHSCWWETLCERWPKRCKCSSAAQSQDQDGCSVPHKPHTSWCTHLHLSRRHADTVCTSTQTHTSI